MLQDLDLSLKTLLVVSVLAIGIPARPSTDLYASYHKCTIGYKPTLVLSRNLNVFNDLKGEW